MSYGGEHIVNGGSTCVMGICYDHIEGGGGRHTRYLMVK